MTRSSVLLFLSLQAWAAFSLAVLVGAYRLKLLPERARRSQRIFLIVMVPPYILTIEVIAFSVLLSPIR